MVILDQGWLSGTSAVRKVIHGAIALMPPSSVEDILTSPDRYDGQRVRVVGMLMFFHENLCIEGDDEETERLWLSPSDSTRVEGFILRMPTFARVEVEGIYLHGRCGHCGGYPGQITAISRLSIVPDAADA